MAWIESHQQLARHPKVLHLASLLGISKPAAIGHLHLLWWWALDFAQNGDLSKWDDVTISDAAEWRRSQAARFREALQESGWLDPDGWLHDWWEYAGRLVEKRKSDAERKAVQRMSGGQSTGHPTDVPRDGRGTVPNPTKPKPKDNPEVDQLCDELARLIEANGSRKPAITARWKDAARRLLETDRRPFSEAIAVVRWSQQDEFWRANVLSMPTLRRQYDRLRLQMQRTPRPQNALDRAAFDVVKGVRDAGARGQGLGGEAVRSLPRPASG